MRYGIPYRIVGGLKFYQRKEIKDLVAYLRVVQNPHDTVSILRIINIPVRNLGQKTIETVQEYSARHQMSFWDSIENIDELQGELPESKINSFKKFAKIIHAGQDSQKKYPASGVIKDVLMGSGYKDFLMDGSEEGEIRYENVLELISVATKYDGIEPGISLSTFLEEVALISDLDSVEESHNVVTLMTLHSAKGLEFPCVFICGVEDGVFPHSRSMIDPQEMEEERRLMYVGMTRAIDELFLLHAGQRMLYGNFTTNSPSQFLMDIPEDLVETNYGGVRVQRMNAFGERPIPVEEEESFVIDLETGDRVNHKIFGEGIVVNVTGGIATVSFKDRRYGVKKLAINVAPMERI